MASKYRLRLGDREVEVEVEEREGGYRIALDGRWRPVSLERIAETAHYSLLIDNRPYQFFAEESAHGVSIVLGSWTYHVTNRWGRGPRPDGPEAEGGDTLGGEWVLTSPMTGVVQEVYVAPGDDVEKGQVVLVVEAMKMQNELRARRAGTVKAVYVTKGQRVEQGTPLLVLL
jgi:biotin carboxyl carrier protein